MLEPIALRVKNLSKSFKLPYDKHSTLKSVIVNPFKKRKGFKRQHVLKNISFEIEKGEFFGIVGRNGGGKSTLLKLLASIYAPENGTIQVAGKLVPFIELGVGFNPELSGRDNVYLNGALLGFSDKEIDEIYDEIVEFAELEKFMDQKLKNYSSGMQVRLAFSVATRSKADVLLVDEVLAVGDAEFQRKCYDYFSTLKSTGKTVIFISHDMNAIREYCDRVILLDEGEIREIGSAEVIAESYFQLFSVQQVVSEKEKKEKRWGNGSVCLAVSLEEITSEFIKIKVQVIAIKVVKDQLVGLSIKGANGEIVYGTNTQLAGETIRPMDKGGKITLAWEIPNIFRDGFYTVAVASHGYGGLPVYDWWDNALKLEIAAGRQSPYAIAPSIRLKISDQ